MRKCTSTTGSELFIVGNGDTDSKAVRYLPLGFREPNR